MRFEVDGGRHGHALSSDARPGEGVKARVCQPITPSVRRAVAAGSDVVTISGYQSYSFSAVTLNLRTASVSTATPTAASSSAGIDRVSLSPAASAPAADASGSPVPVTPTETPVEATPPVSRAARRAEALLTALDADGDGTLTETEFTEGALNLLRNAGARRRIDEDGSDERRETRGVRRLERKLEQAFERVDKNEDGAIDADELTAALSRGRGDRRSGPSCSPPPATATEGTSATPGAGTAVSASFVSVTFVSIAVQRYNAVQADAPATASPTA